MVFFCPSRALKYHLWTSSPYTYKDARTRAIFELYQRGELPQPYPSLIQAKEKGQVSLPQMLKSVKICVSKINKGGHPRDASTWAYHDSPMPAD